MHAYVGLWKHMEWNLMSLHCILGAVILQEAKISPKNKKDLGMAILHPSKSEETRGNAITQSQSHPIKKCRI